MGNRLTLPLLLLAALLAGGAFFWMSGGERRGAPGQGAHETAASAPADRPAVELAHASESPSAPSPEPARAPVERPREDTAPKAAKAKGDTAGVSGRVVDRFGTPIAGARVTVSADAGFPLDMESEREFSWLKRQRAETDADGRFRFEAVEPGSLHLGVKAKGFAPHDQPRVAVPASGVELEPVTMVRGAILTGQVVDADGRGVGGAKIVRDELDDGAGVFMLGTREPAAVSDADGRFRVDELACGPWRFVVRSDDHPDLAVEGVAEEPGVEVGGLRWQLGPGAVIAGTVTGIPSNERDGLEVRASRSASPEGFLGFGSARVAKVEANGAFALRGLQIGEGYTLQARKAQGQGEFGFWERSRSNSVQARAGDNGVVLAYQPEAAVTFSVVDARTRAPIERLEVEAGTEWPIALTDDDGRTRKLFPGGLVRAGGLRPGSASDRVQLTVKATGYEEMHRADIAVRSGQELDLGVIALEPVPLLRVTVTDKKSKKPIEGAVVRLAKQVADTHQFRRSISISNDEGAESVDFGESRSATTDSNGVAELSSYEGETVDVSVRAKGYAPAKHEGLALPRGETIEDALALSLGGEVNVQVLDAQGVALPGVPVEHRAAGAGPEGGVFMIGGPRSGPVTDAQGLALFENLAPGLHSFRLGEKGGGGPVFATADELVIAGGGGGGGDDESWTQVTVVEGERAELTLRAAPRSTLAGRVREAGKVLAGATLSLASDSDSGPGFHLPGMDSGGPEGKSDGEGHYHVEDVKAGHYTLTVAHPTRRMPAEFEIDLREGENTFDVELPLSIVSGRVLDSEGKGLAGVRVWPERQQPEGGRQVRMRMIMVDGDGGGGMVDSGQFGERAVSDAEGRYTLRGVTSDVDLMIKAEGDAVQPAHTAVVRLGPNEVKDGIDLTLEVAGSIRVEAKLADGSPARFQLVQAEYLDESPTPLEPKFGFLQQGSTELTGLKPGRWKVNVRSAQGGPGQGNPGQDKEIEVKPQEKATATFEVE